MAFDFWVKTALDCLHPFYKEVKAMWFSESFCKIIWFSLVAITLNGCGVGKESNPSSDTPPVASAGSIQNVMIATRVTLNGSASSDANGDPLTYTWTLTSKPAGSTATLTDATSATPTFTADLAGEYVASLMVNDGKANSVSASVTITATVNNAAPVANAGSIQNVTTGTLVTLNGSASSDANGDPLTYAWILTTKPASSTATLADATSATPTFTADLAGAYVASLVVNDGKVNSAITSAIIFATLGNATPVANAGSMQNVTTGTLVTLNGSASSDANGDPLTYAWTLTTKPASSTATLTGANSATSTFTADLAGAYVASLVVNDGKVNSASTPVSITATAGGNAAPVANAGSIQNVTTGTLVTLNGSASSDANGDPLTYTWTLTSKPASSAATLTGANSATPTFTADLAGAYVASLVVNDGKVNSASTPVTITATVGGNNATPIADAGSIQNVTTGTLVTLNGSASSDANGDLLTYSWRLISKPAGSTKTMSDPTTVRPTFTPDLAGSYQFELVVKDGKAASLPASVTVSSNSSFNRLQTEKLKGTWTFNFTIGTSPFTDTYILDGITESSTTPGDFRIYDTDLSGDITRGLYSSSSGNWVVRTDGIVLDYLYTFQTDGSTVISGCYYHIRHPSETWSVCYPLSGSKTLIVNNAVTLQSKAMSARSRELSDQLRENEAVGGSPPPTTVLEQYNQLMNR